MLPEHSKVLHSKTCIAEVKRGKGRIVPTSHLEMTWILEDDKLNTRGE